jgi:hypothetical protein
VLRNRFAPKKGEVQDTGENLVMSFVTLCSSLNGIQFIKPWRMREPGNEAYVGGQGRHIQRAGGKKTERKTNLQNLGLDRMIILK